MPCDCSGQCLRNCPCHQGGKDCTSKCNCSDDCKNNQQSLPSRACGCSAGSRCLTQMCECRQKNRSCNSRCGCGEQCSDKEYDSPAKPAPPHFSAHSSPSSGQHPSSPSPVSVAQDQVQRLKSELENERLMRLDAEAEARKLRSDNSKLVAEKMAIEKRAQQLKSLLESTFSKLERSYDGYMAIQPESLVSEEQRMKHAHNVSEPGASIMHSLRDLKLNQDNGSHAPSGSNM